MSDLEIARDDIALSAIAAGNAPDSDDPTLLLLASFRADLDETVAGPEPLKVPSTVAPAVVPLRSRRRSATLLALSAAAGVVFGGLTAGLVAVSDRPGESLYPVHAVVFGKAETKAEDVAALLDQASGMLARGDRAAARRLLAEARTLIPTTPESERAGLRRRVEDLSVYAAEPVRPTPRPTPSATRETPEPSESESEPDDDNSGSNSGSGSSNSGSGSSNSGSGSSGSDDH